MPAPAPTVRQQALQDRDQAEQHDEQLQKIGEPPVTDETVDQIEADRADDDRHQDTEQKEEHDWYALMRGANITIQRSGL